MARLNTYPTLSRQQGNSKITRINPSEEEDQHVSDSLGDSSQASGSDKENNHHIQRGQKRKSAASTMSASRTNISSTSKRRRTDQGHQHEATSQLQRMKQAEEVGNTKFYDPDQNEDEKRETKKKLRDLSSKLNDMRAEFLQPNSRGIQDTLAEADEIYKGVKQTSVATIDSRLLVNVGDLAYRKINTLTLGDSSTGIDVDDFITKCISFMKQGSESGSSQPSASQRQRQRRGGLENDEEDDEEALDLHWSYMGRNACLLYNSRPCLSGFLLGPLSVQKKVRQQSQRRATQRRNNDTQTIRPIQLSEEDLDAQESANLTEVCSEIARLLRQTQESGEKRVEQEVDDLETDDIDETQLRGIMRKHGIADNGGVPLFDFCINPKSFGQTIENFFYVSFLIKEGRVGLDFDSNDLPTLAMANQKSVRERQETQRNQAVFTLDFDMWEELVQSYGIEQSIIPHRNEQDWDDGTLTFEGEQQRDAEIIEDEDMYGPPPIRRGNNGQH